ncbi:YfbU family protein [Novosphingobium mangrovi (ex Hu et al. 2023)]|uniref:YfbU family protein n=1 Tax=Novosphingobium mangrovi (ex Hu et al. 2023) TaxID=2930094 RepID=A0ABT0A9M7_9SPHN|nr:YfbU family protein [Novosphingobium mangrovi (ex Hu et al. 2023)]MCJ1959900.1 YfbU family protein [Novosphingobium mangrovi (ex Hu et al. 2023)]
MQISDGERLIAYMLAELMEKSGEQFDIDPAFIKSALANQDEWAIEWKCPGIFGGDPTEQEVIDETCKILTMWRVIDNSIDQIPEEQLPELPDEYLRQFEGFDLNNDPHYSVAEVLIEQLDRFQERAGMGLNSHSSGSLPRYRALLERFDAIREGQMGPLSIEQLNYIFNN